MENRYNNILGDYGKDRLSFSERFELEKAALDDDFLFEALEGYAYGQQADLNKTQNRLSALIKNTSEDAIIRKLVPYRWVAGVAASVLLLSALIYVFQSSNSGISDMDKKTIVANEVNPVTEIQDETESSIIEQEKIATNEEREALNSIDIPKSEETQPVAKSLPQEQVLKSNKTPESSQTMLAPEQDVTVPKLTEELLTKKSDVITSEPENKAFTLNKNTYLKISDETPAITMELAKETNSLLAEEDLGAEAAEELQNFLIEEIKKMQGFQSTNSNISFILHVDDNSVIQETNFFKGCKACYDSLSGQMVGRKLERINASQVGKRLIFHFKSK